MEATLKNLMQKKKARHKPSGWSMFIISLFDEKKKKKKLITIEDKIALKNYVTN